jgi:hypothetical protein
MKTRPAATIGDDHPSAVVAVQSGFTCPGQLRGNDAPTATPSRRAPRQAGQSRTGLAAGSAAITAAPTNEQNTAITAQRRGLPEPAELSVTERLPFQIPAGRERLFWFAFGTWNLFGFGIWNLGFCN